MPLLLQQTNFEAMEAQPACCEEVAMGCLQCIISSYDGSEGNIYVEVRKTDT